ncbi:hypothetical protein G7077_13465 [Sphingomonas piscis]|uniref:ATPase n=1 Tax=Sphingomonas piscis TaxID=2714943 RepID=A0A6G7YSQ4_9SPHN|nr:hypothetical protein [Sphingomonas piscis]QIK79764.1 hypothetical protein G7077_13465 [Sphingomonas piscis]
MSSNPQRSSESLPPLELDQRVESDGSEAFDGGFDPIQWQESQAETQPSPGGGRTVLAAALWALAALWLGYTAWSAGRALARQPLGSPEIAQWIAVAAGPLALLGLVWIMFGRTRRREAEKFTRSVIAMRTEARSLEGLLGVLSQRIAESHQALSATTERLMSLGDEASAKLGSAAREFDATGDRLTGKAQLIDRAAESARNDLAVILDDLPKAQAVVTSLREQFEGIGNESQVRTAALTQVLADIAERTRDTDTTVSDAAHRLVGHLTQIESAGAAAAVRVSEAEGSFSSALDALLARTVATLDEVRQGVDAQSAAISALVEQAAAGIGRAGVESAAVLGNHVASANQSLDGLSSRVAEQERSAQRMIAEIDRGLALIDQRFTELAANGDERANRFLGSLGRARAELDALADNAGARDHTIEQLAERTTALRESIATLQTELTDNLAQALGEAQAGASTLLETTQAAQPELGRIRDAAAEANQRLDATRAAISGQHEQLSDLLGSIAAAQQDAERLTAETAPALVTALLQVRETASHAAERARDAITSVIPESAGRLSEATKEALEQVIRDSIEEKLRGVEQLAAHAVESARSASDRLTQQMLNLGQSATALERHITDTDKEQRERDSDSFARRVSLLMDSMNSAAIDVGKILSDEVDEKAWDSYLKGNRGVFTRRAVRLLGGTESKAIRSHYNVDGEFQQSVNRYISDFEAMLRRVLADRDGGMMAVTLMSSDMGKLYVALAEAVERRR